MYLRFTEFAPNFIQPAAKGAPVYIYVFKYKLEHLFLTSQKPQDFLKINLKSPQKSLHFFLIIHKKFITKICLETVLHFIFLKKHLPLLQNVFFKLFIKNYKLNIRFVFALFLHLNKFYTICNNIIIILNTFVIMIFRNCISFLFKKNKFLHKFLYFPLQFHNNFRLFFRRS